MMLFKAVVGLVFGLFVGVAIQTIAQGGGVIIGRDYVRNSIDKEERNNRGRFNDLKVTDNDPKFYD